MRTNRNVTRTERLFARLDREPEPPQVAIPRMSRHREVLFGSTLAFYVAIVVAVVITSWLVAVDWKVMLFRPYEQWPGVHGFVDYLVVLGQRGPTAVMVTAWLGWRSWRQHTVRPLLALGVALLLLNVTVGAAKIGMGRLGPHYATQIGSNEMYMGGDIFPSGHTANAVVTWGILAYLAATPRTRRYLSAVSAVIALSVGLSTVYLGTHWLSDVLLGWAAGLLILLALPWFEPLIARTEARVFALRERWRTRRTGVRVPAAGSAPAPVVFSQDLSAELPPEGVVPTTGGALAEKELGEPAGAGHAQAAVTATRTAAHASRTHTARSERTPVTPTGSRRPPHADRAPRTATARPS
ncbi:phosphatase PAP2 family protein [Streptomyces sp. NPDC060194]|uniref:phosphatase PAP2 family protein n=1 Tax=Streptomyces sp. NPDC060194 TaxID=3347069 RepID=UPI003648325A